MSEPERREHADRTVEDAVERGEDVRGTVRDAVVDAVESAGRGARSLREAVEDVVRRAMDAAKRVEDRDSTRAAREVVDGIADGLARAGQGVRYAVEEAEARGERFAREDVDRTVRDLETALELLVGVVGDAARSAEREASAQWRDLREHAERMTADLRPRLRDTAERIRREPGATVVGSAELAAGATRRAAGALLGALGDAMRRAADRLDGGRDDA